MSEHPIDMKVLTVRGQQVSVANMLGGMATMGATELFLKTGSGLRFNIGGRLALFDSETITPATMDHVLSCFLGPQEVQRFHGNQSADVVHVAGDARFRVHFGYSQTGPYASICVVGSEVLPLENLGLPKGTQARLRDLPSGLVLLCGTNDAGKTVTATSLLEYYNQNLEKAILAIEAPVEHILEDKKALLIQREVGTHVPDFASGIQSAIRESMDIIFVSELHDPAAIEQALRAADLGHHVIATVQAEDCLTAITRLIGSFGDSEQPRIRQALASNLSGVVFQRLLPKTGGGRVPCVETIWANRAVRSIMRTGELSKLGSYVGATTGGLGYLDCLRNLRSDSLIEVAVFESERDRLAAGV